jgi:hypothetical protein
MAQYIRLVHLIAASKQILVGSARGQTETRASYRYQQLFYWLENGSGCIKPATFLLPLQKSCQCARSHIKQCSPSRQLNRWAARVASAPLAKNTKRILVRRRTSMVDRAGHRALLKLDLQNCIATSSNQMLPYHNDMIAVCNGSSQTSDAAHLTVAS